MFSLSPCGERYIADYGTPDGSPLQENPVRRSLILLPTGARSNASQDYCPYSPKRLEGAFSELPLCRGFSEVRMAPVPYGPVGQGILLSL